MSKKKEIKRRDFWARHLEDWKKSGLNQTAYCQIHDVSRSTFARWKKILSAKQSPFIQVPVHESSFESQGRLRVVMNRFTVEVEPGFDDVTLGRLLETLGRI